MSNQSLRTDKHIGRKSRPAPNHYEIGYGRPPKQHQFKAGQSGNPKGRPKGKPNVKKELEQFYLELVSLNDGKRIRKVTRVMAVHLKQWEMAIKGNPRAAQAVTAAAKGLGLFDEPPSPADAPAADLTDAEIDSLSDQGLRDLIRIEEERERVRNEQ